MWWLSVATLAFADPVHVSGIARWHSDPTTLEAGASSLALQNPHLTRSRLWVEEVALGLVDPRAKVHIDHIRSGPWSIRWETPTGFVRHETVRAVPGPTAPPTPPSPEESERTSER